MTKGLTKAEQDYLERCAAEIALSVALKDWTVKELNAALIGVAVRLKQGIKTE